MPESGGSFSGPATPRPVLPAACSMSMRTTGSTTTPGYAVFTVSVDGTEIGSARAKVYAMSEMPIEGLPVKWEFCPVKGSTEDVNALKARQPDWVTSAHSLVSEDGRAYITVVEAAGKRMRVEIIGRAIMEVERDGRDESRPYGC